MMSIADLVQFLYELQGPGLLFLNSLKSQFGKFKLRSNSRARATPGDVSHLVRMAGSRWLASYITWAMLDTGAYEMSSIDNNLIYCSLCDLYFSSQHERAIHIRDSEKHPSCDKCDRRFANIMVLRNVSFEINFSLLLPRLKLY